MKKEVQTTKSGYPLMRYLSLLLVVALLFSGVTFARFALERRGSIDTGVALFDASYTVEGVNSLTFGNQSYWQTLAGGWYAQGGSRTVRIGMRNNSDVEVRANVLHMEGPAEFWENIALQLTTVKKEIESETGYAAGEVVTTQYVLADFLRKRGNGRTASSQDDKSTPVDRNENGELLDESGQVVHQFEYGEYIDWEGDGYEFGSPTEADCNFDTGFSDEFGQRGSIEETFQMSGGISATWEEENTTYDLSKVTDFRGSVTAVRQSARDTANNNTSVFSGQDLIITITASMKPVQYSVGYVRKDGNSSMPAFYLDCVKTVPYYTIDITLPDNYTESDSSHPYFVLGAKPADGSTGEESFVHSLLVFLTWTNSLPSSDLSTDIAPTPEDLATIATTGDTFNDAQVIGYHFNYNDVPATQKNGQSIETTVRMNKALNTWTVGEDGAISTTPVDEGKQITWEHIASINSGEGAYPHPLIEQTDKSYRCNRENYVEINAGVLGSGKYDGSFSSSEFETTTVENKTVCVAAEKGYAVRFGVDFVQHSELPE